MKHTNLPAKCQKCGQPLPANTADCGCYGAPYGKHDPDRCPYLNGTAAPRADRMVGRKVRHYTRQDTGTVAVWEPLGAAMCDARVEWSDGQVCWYASHELTPADADGPLPDRMAERNRARLDALRQCLAIRKELVRDWHTPWPGAEHGKALIGQAIDGAIEALTWDKS